MTATAFDRQGAKRAKNGHGERREAWATTTANVLSFPDEGRFVVLGVLGALAVKGVCREI